ncbi:MAG: hypothetical protein K0U21_07415 [Proteobacteria bacterium]|nr:hypothetical protein [Pseudomonadota bacterium]
MSDHSVAPMLSSDEAPTQNAPSVDQSVKASPWLLWTGVLGAFFALVALFALWFFGQRLLVLEAAQQQLADQAQQVTQLQATLDVVRQQQQAIADGLTSRVDLLAEALVTLEKKKAIGMQITAPVMVRFMLSQLRTVAWVHPEPIQLAQFLAAWQQQLRSQGVADDHALMQALAQESAALRTDIPTWSSESEAWLQLKQQLDQVESAPSSLMVTPEQDDMTGRPWWQRLQAFIKITPTTENDTEIAAQVRSRSVWVVQTQLALAQIRFGLLTNQSVIVNQSGQVLQQLLAQQTPSLAAQWQSRLAVWQSWQGLPMPDWHYLENYLSAQEKAAL